MEIDTDHIADFDEFVSQFKDESDRAAVILGTAKLDTLLLRLISHFLVPNPTKTDDLLDGDSPLCTFSARISLSYRLGLIDAQFAKGLHLIRKIRNQVAHEVEGGRLEAAPQRDRIRELTRQIAASKLFVDVKQAYFGDKDGVAADLFATIAIMAARLDTLMLKVVPLSDSHSHPIIPEKSARKPRTSGPSI